MEQKGGGVTKYRSGYVNTARYQCLEDLQGDSMELCLIYCGREACNPGHRYGPNRRSTYVLHFVKEGRGSLEIDGEVYELGPGDAFLIQPEVEAWYEADDEEPWTYLWVGFSGFKAEECVASAGFSAGSPVHKIECVDQLVFSKIFKQYYGVSPKAYRESEQELMIGVEKGVYPGRDI